jgi:HEAT repeat protein
MKKPVLACTLAALAFCTTPVFSQEDGTAYREGYDLILAQRWVEAREHFGRFQQQWPDSAWADDAAFWQCYAQEQPDSDQEASFQCYEEYIASWPNSSWVADARSKLLVLGSELASRGRPQFLERLEFDDEDDFDSDQGRGTADDELLSILVAELADSPNDGRASDILMQRFDASDDVTLRNRIVLLMEEIDGEEITRKLMAITEQDESMQVRENAVIVLLDREDAVAHDRLAEILRDEDFGVDIRSEIISNMDDWNDERALSILQEILTGSTEPDFIEEAVGALAENGSEAAVAIFLDAFNQQQDVQLRYVMLEQIAELEAPAVMNLLSETALTSADDELAAIAIEGIAEREDNVAVAALDHIYFTTENRQRKLAALDGLGETENAEALEVLRRIIATETQPQLLAEAASALGNTEQEGAIAILVELYRGSNNIDVQRGAISGLSELDDFPAANTALLDILEDRLNATDAE